MHVVVWLTVAAVVGVLAIVVLAVRRGRDGDLGSVSGSWIAQHREN
jgi:hypothetical protein